MTRNRSTGGSPATARERLRAEQEHSARRDRRVKVIVAVTSVVVVLAIIVTSFWAVGHHQREQAQQDAHPSGAGSSHVLADALLAVPQDITNPVGMGSAQYSGDPITGGRIQREGGKPRLLYVGGEFCPYCAMERPALVIALNRFGTFKNLTDATSSPQEKELASIPTVTFHGASYTSDYLVFKGYEVSDESGNKLDNPPQADWDLFNEYSPNQGLPFTYWGDRTTNVPLNDGPVLSQKSAAWMARQLRTNDNDVSKAVFGAANMYTALICRMTNDQPAKVCTAPGVVTAKKAIG